MGWWLGRKSAPTDARPFVPAWLNSDSVEEGFARSCEGMTLYERKSGTWATFRGGAWEIGNVRGSSLLLGDRQVVGPQAPAIEPPAGGSVVDAEARTAIEAILDRLHQHGLIAE